MSYKSEKELIKLFHQNTHLIDQHLAKQKLTMDELGAITPGIVQVNSKDDLSLKYVSNSLESIDLAPEEFVELGTEFFDLYIHPETIENVFPRFINFYEQGDESKVHGEFQKVKRTPESDEYNWFITSVKISKAEGVFLGMTLELKDFGTHAEKIARILDDDQFLRQNYERFATLTKMEKEVLRLLAQGLRNKDIAEKFFISPNTVRTHRNNIHRKLDIRGKNINHVALYICYAEAFGLL